ncbi:unnamed protein product [Closterium sp. Yama58-4]|nr:unnamed protein product [Closterium sp. Yama58-4]
MLPTPWPPICPPHNQQVDVPLIAYVHPLSLFWRSCLQLFSHHQPFAAAPISLPPDRFSTSTLLLAPSENLFQAFMNRLSSPLFPTDSVNHFLNAAYSSWYTSPPAHRLPLSYATPLALKPYTLPFLAPFHIITLDGAVPPYGNMAGWRGQPRFRVVLGARTPDSLSHGCAAHIRRQHQSYTLLFSVSLVGALIPFFYLLIPSSLIMLLLIGFLVLELSIPSSFEVSQQHLNLESTLKRRIIVATTCITELMAISICTRFSLRHLPLALLVLALITPIAPALLILALVFTASPTNGVKCGGNCGGKCGPYDSEQDLLEYESSNMITSRVNNYQPHSAIWC